MATMARMLRRRDGLQLQRVTGCLYYCLVSAPLRRQLGSSLVLQCVPFGLAELDCPGMVSEHRQHLRQVGDVHCQRCCCCLPQHLHAT